MSIKYQISNYPAATADKLCCCTAALVRLVPLFLLPPSHNAVEELHQLLLVPQVGVASKVTVSISFTTIAFTILSNHSLQWMYLFASKSYFLVPGFLFQI